MATVNLKENFNRIYLELHKTNNLSQIVKAMGYTSSAQLHSAVSGSSMLSTKAIISLIENFNINPAFLFLGSGEIFLNDEAGSELEKLRKENREWIQRHGEMTETVLKLNEMIKKLEQRNADLIDLSAAAIKFHKKQKEDTPKTDEQK
jgi:hypothetical protein